MKKLSQEELNKLFVAHEAWLKKEPGGKQLYLHGVDLSGTDWGGRNVRKCRLIAVIFRGAKLDGTELNGSELVRVKFERCSMCQVDLSHCKIERCKFVGSVLREAWFVGTNLRDVDVVGCIFGNNNMYRMKGRMKHGESV